MTLLKGVDDENEDWRENPKGGVGKCGEKGYVCKTEGDEKRREGIPSE